MECNTRWKRAVEIQWPAAQETDGIKLSRYQRGPDTSVSSNSALCRPTRTTRDPGSERERIAREEKRHSLCSAPYILASRGIMAFPLSTITQPVWFTLHSPPESLHVLTENTLQWLSCTKCGLKSRLEAL